MPKRVKGVTSVIFILSFIILFISPAKAISIKGIVFEDLDKDGIYDIGEEGLSNVPVSDGKGIVLTDEDGQFSLSLDEGARFVFITTPRDYRPTNGWYRNLKELKDKREIFFGLRQEPQSDEFLFIQFSDSHLHPVEDRNLASLLSFVNEVAATDPKPSFLMGTGDLVDTCSRGAFEHYTSAISSLDIPVFSVLGNHELFYSPPGKEKELYMDFLGPTYYSFDWASFHFVVLDANLIVQSALDARSNPDIRYSIDALQLAWLNDDLAICAKKKPVVLALHEPEAYSKTPGLINILHGYKVLACLAGHIHQRVELQGEIKIVVCGPLLKGDAHPPSYWLYWAKGKEGTLSWTWRDPGRRYQVNIIRVADRIPSPEYPMTDPIPIGKDRNSFTAIVFPAREESRIEWRIDEGFWKSANLIEKGLWNIYRAEIEADFMTPGLHRLSVRALIEGKEVPGDPVPVTIAGEEKFPEPAAKVSPDLPVEIEVGKISLTLRKTGKIRNLKVGDLLLIDFIEITVAKNHKLVAEEIEDFQILNIPEGKKILSKWRYKRMLDNVVARGYWEAIIQKDGKLNFKVMREFPEEVMGLDVQLIVHLPIQLYGGTKYLVRTSEDTTTEHIFPEKFDLDKKDLPYSRKGITVFPRLGKRLTIRISEGVWQKFHDGRQWGGSDYLIKSANPERIDLSLQIPREKGEMK